jgi:uncharacterized protein YjiS (DUF1127 family)
MGTLNLWWSRCCDRLLSQESTMNQLRLTCARSSAWIARLLCQFRLASTQRRDRAALAALDSRALRDLGLSHADALPLRQACCG